MRELGEWSPTVALGDRAYFGHFGNVVPQQVFNAHFQRQRGRRAASAGALHVKVHNAAFKAVEGDVAAILGNGRAHTAVEQFFDLAHNRAVFASMLGMAGGRVVIRAHDRLTGLKVFHDRAQKAGFEMIPLNRLQLLSP